MTPRPTFILASASPRRVDLLRQIGLTADQCLPADIDEKPHKNELPQTHAERLAREKAEKVGAENPNAVILAADTVVACGRRILPKTENEAQARACLKLLSGRRHRVHTAVAVRNAKGSLDVRTVTAHVRFKRLTKDEIEAYVKRGEWRGKAGGYAIQGKAAGLIPWISGSVSCIVGLPLFETQHMLRSAGVIPKE